MRSFWLSVAVLGGVLLLAGLSGCAAKVHGGRKAQAKQKDAAPEAQQQQRAEPKAEVVSGYGETASAARANALREAQDWLERELRTELKSGWSVPRKQLEPAYLEKMGVINVEKADKPTPDPEAGGAMRQQYKVTLMPQYVNAVVKESREEWVAHENQERQGHAVVRQHVVLRVLGGVLALLLVVAGYLRLEEATRGYYTALLRVAALGVLATVVLALLMIG
jgi:hypothetical protein